MPDNGLKFTSMIVSSFLGKNRIGPAELTTLIRKVHTAFTDVDAPAPEPAPPRTPAVSIRRSVTPDAIICMDCGKPFKSLRRHLATSHDLSPEAYREKWDLPKTYPMVAAAYSSMRSAMAKSFGLGSRGSASAPDTITADPTLAAPELPHAPPASAPKPRARVRAAGETKAKAAKLKTSRSAKPRTAE
jgi:predicted transcriptional regulator